MHAHPTALVLYSPLHHWTVFFTSDSEIESTADIDRYADSVVKTIRCFRNERCEMD